MRTFRVLKRSTFINPPLSYISVRNLEVRMDILMMKEFVERNENYFNEFNKNYMESFEEYIVWLEGDDDVMYTGGNLDGKSIAYKGFFLMRKWKCCTKEVRDRHMDILKAIDFLKSCGRSEQSFLKHREEGHVRIDNHWVLGYRNLDGFNETKWNNLIAGRESIHCILIEVEVE